MAQAKCRFSKKNNNSYVLTVDLDLLGLFGPVVLYYGAIVQKLPENATVTVEVLPLEVNKDIQARNRSKTGGKIRELGNLEMSK